MKLRLALAPLLVASVAHAQAPGEAEVLPPGMAPAVAANPPEPLRRWSVGIGIGFTDLAPHSAPEATTSYSLGQIAVRYLLRRHVEFELALSGGREQLDDGSEGNRELSQGVLAVRWRFAPQRRWNGWLMAGMGTLAVTSVDATDGDRESASQSTLQFGVGVERRFRRWSLQVEVRAVGVAPNEVDGDAPPMLEPTRPGGMDLTTTSPSEGKAGGQFALSGNYYF